MWHMNGKLTFWVFNYEWELACLLWAELIHYMASDLFLVQNYFDNSKYDIHNDVDGKHLTTS